MTESGNGCFARRRRQWIEEDDHWATHMPNAAGARPSLSCASRRAQAPDNPDLVTGRTDRAGPPLLSPDRGKKTSGIPLRAERDRRARYSADMLRCWSFSIASPSFSRANIGESMTTIAPLGSSIRRAFASVTAGSGE